jgi:hypothetical protein
VNLGGSGVGGREAIVTLVACALLGFEAVPNLLFGLVVVFGTGGTPYSPFSGPIGLVGGCALGLVLLRQGGVSVPSREERGATRGALAGFAVGVAIMFFLSENFGILGTCTLVGLAIGRTFDRPSIHRSA